jgi:hypothetical protein
LQYNLIDQFLFDHPVCRQHFWIGNLI